MRIRKRIWTGITASLGLLILILDAKTALIGARDGIELCLYTVIPSLFPFFVLSCIISNAISGMTSKILRPLGKVCGIPEGAESLLLLGLIGGYPVGAQAISDAYEGGTLSKRDAHRMLGFCSNAGPAFIFGMISSLFSSAATAWFLWLIHILSALIVGILLPKTGSSRCLLRESKEMPLPQALNKSIKTMSAVCGWVIVFRIVIAFCQRWFLWLFPVQAQAAIIGILELTNGCTVLLNIPSQGVRFVLSAVMLGFGGICVGMQTVSTVKNLGTGMYFPGKILQTIISFLLAGLLQQFIISADERWTIPVIFYIAAAVIAAAIWFILLHSKKVVAIPC